MSAGRKFFSSKTRNKLILGTAVVLTIAILGVTLVLYSMASTALTDQSREAVSQQMQHLQRTLNVELAEYEQLLLSLRLDRSLHDQIKKTDYANYTDFSVKMGEIGTRVRAAMSACSYIPEVTIYLALDYGYEMPPDEVVHHISEVQQTEWMQEAINSNRSQLRWSIYTMKVSEKVSRTMLCATIPIVDRDTGKLLAVARLDQQMRYVMAAMPATVDLQNGDLYIVDATGQLVYGIENEQTVTNVPEELAVALDGVDPLPQTPEIIELEKYTLFTTYDTKRDWNILYTTESGLFLSRNLQFSQRTMGLLIVTIVGSLLLVFVTSDLMTRRLRQLTASVKTVDEQVLTIDYSDDGKDEVSDLYQAFSKLLQRVRNLIDRNQRIEREKYALELQRLQEQVAPHFLYNTLSSINAMAQDIEADDISTAVLSLAEFYRLSLSNGASIVSLKTERELLEYYVDICRIRFGDKVSITMDFDESLSEYKTPKLVLQPFVENSIMHGLREAGDACCHVRISIFAEEDHVCMRVEDDGIGISADQLAAIQAQDYDPQKHHAIQNIHRRIQLFCGPEYGVSISSTPGHGTTVLLTIPKILTDDESQSD